MSRSARSESSRGGRRGEGFMGSYLDEYQVEQLPGLGWITITEVGEENMYFRLWDGTRCFCKVAA